MANNVEAYCPVCDEVTDYFAYVEGWRCDDCDRVNDDIYENPYIKD